MPTLHSGQVRALQARQPSARQLGLDPTFAESVARVASRYKVVRCGRRWGKTDFLKTWAGDGALKGEPCAIFAPDYKRMSEVYVELANMLRPAMPSSGGTNKTDGVIRLITGGRIDFWTLGDENAGRSRKYKRVAIDESAFTAPNMMDIWERAIEPTLLDYMGECITASNTNGIDPSNFLWRVCNEAKHGFVEVHEPSWRNPYVPGRLPGRTDLEHAEDRKAYFRALRARTHPLVYAQEYDSEFVDWSGVAFFSLDKWLVDGQPVEMPAHCDTVFAVIDSATKTGSENDGTAVIYMARNKYAGTPVVILDWEVLQIEGALLDAWLPSVMTNLQALAKRCGAREGVSGIWIEDKSSGIVLLQQGRKRNLPVRPIGGSWLTLGKDERALSVSGYHYQEQCKIAREPWLKTTEFKGTHRNHLAGQVAGFRIGDPKAARRADDLLDTYTHGLALALGDSKQF